MGVSVLSWNLLEGCLAPFDPDLDRRAVDLPRLKAAQDLVASVNPDILIVNEALHCEPSGGLHQDYAALFGFPHAHGRLYDVAWGNVVLSKFPILDVFHDVIHKDGGTQNRGMLAAKIATPDGPLWVLTYHPHPHRRPHKRAEDFAAFIARFDGPALLAGDLNALHPDDGVDRCALVEAFTAFQSPENAAASVDRFLRAGQLLFNSVLPAAGWRDAFPAKDRGATIPTRLISATHDSDMRIDHVLVSAGVAVEDAQVLHDPRADVASDHYPLLVRVAVAPAA